MFKFKSFYIKVFKKVINFFKIDFDSKKRIYGLDILRAFAILFVVIGHGIKVLPKGNYFRSISMYLDFDGVSIFFVLSGFLIGTILIKILERKDAIFKTLYDFWVRRWLRTLPNYFFVLFLLVIILPFIYTGSLEDSLVEKMKFLFFIQNVYTDHPYFFPEAWSLSIEEWFYLLIPIYLFALVGLVRMKPKIAILVVSISVLLTITYFRYYKLLEVPIITSKQWDLGFRKQVVTRLDSLMYGVLGAYVAYYYKKIWCKYKVIVLFVGILLFCIEKYLYLLVNTLGFGIYKSVFSFSVTSLATLFVIPFLSEYKIGKGIIYKLITIISLISYSMYLINLSVVQGYILTCFPENLAEYSWFRYFCFWAVTLVGSILLYKFIELPFMKLREKLK